MNAANIRQQGREGTAILKLRMLDPKTILFPLGQPVLLSELECGSVFIGPWGPEVGRRVRCKAGWGRR